MIRFLTLIFSAILSLSASADFYPGAGVFTGYVVVPDDEGDGSTIAVIPSVTGTFDLRARGQRVVSGLGYFRGSVDASSSTVGQNVSGFSFYSRWERRTPITRDLADFYISVGAQVFQLTHTERHTVEDGYLKERFSDSDSTALNLNLGGHYPLYESREAAHLFGVMLDLPLTGGQTAFGINYQFQYR